ncbi:ATP-grasp domain-containing protein [Halomonas organivorans]
MNIMLTCAGRRNYLIGFLKRALGGDGLIFATDCNPSAPALHEADVGCLVPPVSDPRYIDSLLALCLSHEVQLLIPLNDLELMKLARERLRFSRLGIKVVVSPPEVIEIANDKLETSRFVQSLDLRAPITHVSLSSAIEDLEAGRLKFPLYIKPRWGTASVGVESVHDVYEMQLAWELAHHRLPRLTSINPYRARQALLIQEALPGTEFGLDVINDLEGHYRAVFVKKKLSMRAGETERAVVEDLPPLQHVGRRLGEVLSHCGNLDCDVFFDGAHCYVLELNPRFGGGYPFSDQAGADVMAALIAWAQGKEPSSGWSEIRCGITSSKCDRLVDVSNLDRLKQDSSLHMATPC